MDWSNSIGPLKGVHRGREEVIKFWLSFLDAFDSLQWVPEEVIDIDESRVIVVNLVRKSGRSSGVRVEATAPSSGRSGTARVEHQVFESRAEALEAAGLSE